MHTFQNYKKAVEGSRRKTSIHNGKFGKLKLGSSACCRDVAIEKLNDIKKGLFDLRGQGTGLFYHRKSRRKQQNSF